MLGFVEGKIRVEHFGDKADAVDGIGKVAAGGCRILFGAVLSFRLSLPALGYEGVSNVHVGRMVELDVPGDGDVPARVAEMCEKLLANPLIEDFEIEQL